MKRIQSVLIGLIAIAKSTTVLYGQQPAIRHVIKLPEYQA
jgi:hypothetical protein